MAELLGFTKRSVIVLGPSGAGKTTLAELVQAAMSAPVLPPKQPRDRVPVYLHLSEWDPAAKDLVAWALGQLTRKAALSGMELVSSAATLTYVLKEGRCLLLLDGFDELDLPVQEQAVRNIVNNRSVGPIVIFSQGTLDQLLFATKLLTCDVVMLEPLSAEYVADLVRLSATPGSSWSEVAERVSSSPRSVLASVLRRPLYLSLALHMVQQDEQAPVVLVQVSATKEHIERALLKAAVGAALASRPDGVSGFRAQPQGVDRWLKSLGRIQLSQRRDNTVWWDIADEGPVWGKAVVGGVLVYAVLALAELGTFVAFGSRGTGTVLPLALATFVALATKGNPYGRGHSQARWYRSGAMRFGVAFTLAVATFFLMDSSSKLPLLTAVTSSLVLGAAYLGMALAFRRFRRWILLGPTTTASVFRTWVRGLGFSSDHLPRAVPRQVGWAVSKGKLAAASLLGLIAAAGLVLIDTSPSAGMSSLPDFLAHNGPATAAGLFATNLLFFTMALSFGKPLDSKRARGQAASVRSNLAFGSISICLWFLAFGVTTSVWVLGTESAAGISRPSLQVPVVGDPAIWLWILAGLVAVVLLFGPLIVVGATMTLGGRFLLALLWLWLVGAAPLRYFAFLKWGQDCGLLRRQGLAYAFRHPRLRDTIVQETGRPEIGQFDRVITESEQTSTKK